MFSSIPLIPYQSLGTETVNKLKGLDEAELLKEQIKAAQLKNKYEPKMNELNMQSALQQADRANQLFPEQLKQQQLANQMSQLKVQDYLPTSQANNAYKNALTQRMAFQQANPLYGQPGVAGQIGAANLAPQDQRNLIMKSINQSQLQKQAQSDLNTKRAEGYEFNSLPGNDKSYLLAQAAGMGVEPNEAAKMFNKGKTINQIAEEQGFDPANKPDPIYPLTPAGQTQLKARTASLAELKKMGGIISEWAGPYARKVAGFSPEQVKDALTGKNEDQQAKFLAARMLAPEQQAIRIKSMGGNVGIEAIREMTDLALMHSKILQPLVSPKVFQKANDYVESAIYDSVTAANEAATKAIGSKKSSIPETKNVMTYNPATGRLE